MPPLEDQVATGILALWESHWQPLLDLMLIFYIEQDDGWNFIQHPSSTCQFATAFIKIVPGLSDKDQFAASILIHLSSLEKDGPRFDLEDGLEADDMDNCECDLYVEVDKLDKGPLKVLVLPPFYQPNKATWSETAASVSFRITVGSIWHRKNDSNM